MNRYRPALADADAPWSARVFIYTVCNLNTLHIYHLYTLHTYNLCTLCTCAWTVCSLLLDLRVCVYILYANVIHYLHTCKRYVASISIPTALYLYFCVVHMRLLYIHAFIPVADSLNQSPMQGSHPRARWCVVVVLALPHCVHAMRRQKERGIDEGKGKRNYNTKKHVLSETNTYLWLWHGISYLNETCHIWASRRWVESHMTWM